MRALSEDCLPFKSRKFYTHTGRGYTNHTEKNIRFWKSIYARRDMTSTLEAMSNPKIYYFLVLTSR